MWITEKKSREITPEMIESMMAFLSVAAKYGCLGSTFAEDDTEVDLSLVSMSRIEVSVTCV